MTSDQLAVERAAWAVALKHEFKSFPQYQYREHFNDYQTIFVVTRSDTPGWKANITICSAHNRKNRVEVDRVVIGWSGRASTCHKALAAIAALWTRHDKDMVGLKAKEDEAAKWQKRQDKELGGMRQFPGIEPEIITAGPHAGKYCISFLPGHMFEHLTLDQFKQFYVLCCQISPKS